MIICVAGMPGSGKGVFKKAAEALGIPRISMGDIVRRETARRGLTPDYHNTARIMLELRREAGPEVFAKLTWEEVSSAKEPAILIDGVRSLDEVDYFKQFGDTVVVAVHSSPRTRFERLRKRGRPDDVKTYEEFEERDARELSVGLGSVIALADYMLVNEGISEEKAVKRAREILEVVLDRRAA
ncbi:TPA: flagellar hook-basal body complex protein FliE [Candidatus Micrarchaeota archaeon]|nr:flagellar hook-basal body complex protein FliE [Candidatus Micrarchaeota archaeon]